MKWIPEYIHVLWFQNALESFYGSCIKPLIKRDCIWIFWQWFVFVFSTFNMYRQTPCDLASSLGYDQCAQFLRSHGCATGNMTIHFISFSMRNTLENKPKPIPFHKLFQLKCDWKLLEFPIFKTIWNNQIVPMYIFRGMYWHQNQ